MLGGMWGFRGQLNRMLANRIFGLMSNKTMGLHYNWRGPVKGEDQFFLRDHVYDLFQDNDVVSHDSYHCQLFGKGFRPFPTRRNGNCFVGDPFDCSNGSFYECPTACRPPEHLDWNFC